MREILLRSYDEELESFYYFFNGKYYSDIDLTCELEPSFHDMYFNWNNAEYFTEVLDKNGNKIFESDFVIDNDGNKTVIVWIKEWSMFGCMFLEEFEKYQLNGISELDESMFWTFPIENNLIEIIRNIHK